MFAGFVNSKSVNYAKEKKRVISGIWNHLEKLEYSTP